MATVNMASDSVQDETETAICGFKEAQQALAELPPDHPQLSHWHRWADEVFQTKPWQPGLQQAMTIAYARMALRNGALSDHPRSYHNELHINDLLSRLMYCAKRFQQLTPNGLAVMSIFAACHDLRQAEPRLEDNLKSLVGANEKASFEEAQRIIQLVDDDGLWTEHHVLLLKTMIEGSTFGSGGKRSKNFFQGNLAKHLLEQLQLPNKNDEQLVLLGCDLDTANVSLPISEFALSAVHIFDELITHEHVPISAHQFFSEQQKIYFFEQQTFNADITRELFSEHKQHNSDKLIALSEHIEQLPADMPAEQIKAEFLRQAKQLEYS